MTTQPALLGKLASWKSLLPSGNNFIIGWKWSPTKSHKRKKYKLLRTFYFGCFSTLFVHSWNFAIFSFSKPLNSQSSWVVTSSPSRQRLGQNTMKSCSAVMRGGCQRRERLVVMCCHRGYSQGSDQPPLQARRSYRNTKAHTHIQSQITSTRHTGLCAKQGHAHHFWIASWLELRGSWGSRMSQQSIIPHLPLLLTRSQSSKHLLSSCQTHSSERSCLVQLTLCNSIWLTTRNDKHS